MSMAPMATLTPHVVCLERVHRFTSFFHFSPDVALVAAFADVERTAVDERRASCFTSPDKPGRIHPVRPIQALAYVASEGHIQSPVHVVSGGLHRLSVVLGLLE